MEAVETQFRYARASSVEGGSLQLSTAQDQQAHYPYFFQGQVHRPEMLGACLKALAKVVANRFFTPPAMLARLFAESDPVITCGNEVLRFEGFSACCGVYGRVDLSPDSYQGVVTHCGTTNVDFNPQMLKELAQIRGREQIGLAVGSDEFVLLKDTEAVVEKKVKLPLRWIKGFLAVQASQARMQPRFSLDRVAATRLLRSFPKSSGSKDVYWISEGSGAPRLSKIQSDRSLAVGGIGRLHLLQELLPRCRTVDVYSDPESDASAWVVDLNGYAFTLVLSPEVWRGFSGEGAGLDELAATPDEDLLAELLSALNWQSEVSAQGLASYLELPVADVERALPLLGNQGLLGYDLTRRAYFHRVLPFKVERADQLNPRLKGARKLLAQNKVFIDSNEGGKICSRVGGSGVEHRVEIDTGADKWSCTCLWYARHQGARGPCKHALATRLLIQEK